MSGNNMKPEKVVVEQFRVVGPGRELSYSDFSGAAALWEEFGARAGEIEGADSTSKVFGVMWGTPEKFLYVAGFPSSKGKIPNGMHEITIPTGNYAKFIHHATGKDGFSESLQQAFMQIMQKDIADAGFSFRHAPTVEYYGPKFKGETMTGEIEIWVPVD